MFQNIPKDKVLEVVKQGPTYPSKIVKIVGGDTMIVGAVLSTLISTGDVKVSTLKIGGTPLYYVPGQESKLEEFMDHLNEKDHKTANILKEAKILKDSDQDPLIRVSLRTIKDFAKSFEIENNGVKELFWRYYLVLKDEAILLAKNILKETIVSSPVAIVETINPVKVEVSTVIETEQDSKPVRHRKEAAEKVVSSDDISKIDFFEIVKKHILSKNLDIISKEKIKKSEYDFVLKNHDNNEYIYCKSKDKKSINDGDLASAFVFAQSKKMPCLFITTGHLTKKAEHMMTKEFNGLQLEQI
jgi:hypothetical protein